MEDSPDSHSTMSSRAHLDERKKSKRRTLEQDRSSRRRHSLPVRHSSRSKDEKLTEPRPHTRRSRQNSHDAAQRRTTENYSSTKSPSWVGGDGGNIGISEVASNQNSQSLVGGGGVILSEPTWNPIEEHPEPLADSPRAMSASSESLTTIPQEGLSATLDKLRGKLSDGEDRTLIDQVQHQIKDKEDRLSRAVMSLMRMQEADTLKKSDDYFKASVLALRVSIKYWSLSQVPLNSISHSSSGRILKRFLSPDPKPVASGIEPGLRDLVPTYCEYEKSPERFAKRVQVFTWAFLVTKVFGFVSWAKSGQGDDLGRLKKAYADFAIRLGQGLDRNIPKMEHFHQWRVMSVRLMGSQISHRSIHEAAALISKEINHELRLTKGPENSELSEIIDQVLQLDTDFARQKAYYYFELPGSSSEFDPDTMNIDRASELDQGSGSGRQRVDLLLAPPLFKKGNSEGKGYDSERLMLLKADVVCR